MTCVFLKKGDCSGYDMRLEWKSLPESTHSSNFSLRLNRENSKSWNSSILSMLRGSILQHSKLECPARLASCLCTLCFWTKLNFNRGGDPPSGGREGEKGKGGRAEGTCPRGALARSASPPLPPPPPGSQEPDRKSLSLFFSSSSFYFFGSTCHQLRDCCQGSFLLSLSLSLCNVLLLPTLAFLKCSIL